MKKHIGIMLGIAVVFVFLALFGLQIFANSSGVDGSLEGNGAHDPVNQVVNFSEKVRQAGGSVEALAAEAPDDWLSIAPGVAYKFFQVDGPNRVHVARMDRSANHLFIESMVAQGRVSGGLETVSQMYKRYDGAVNYWGDSWGGTNQALVAINGSFYDVNDGIADRGIVHGGGYASRYSDHENGSGFVWSLERDVFIGECVYHNPGDQYITLIERNGRHKYSGINVPRGEDQIVIYTPLFDQSTKTDDQGVEILLELQQPLLILPEPGMVTGKVIGIFNHRGNIDIPFGHIVISASGKMRTRLVKNIEEGHEIGITTAVTHFEEDCMTPLRHDWTKAYASVGGGVYFLEDGEIKALGDTPRHPRTAIAFNLQFIYFVVVDGREPGVSEGMSILELANFTKNMLAATHGINQDGGGSATMVIDGLVVNKPSDRIEVDCADLVDSSVVQQSRPNEAVTASSESEKCYSPLERAVANGLMMAISKISVPSITFKPGLQVQVSNESDVYQGPGDNFAIIHTIAAGGAGVVLENSPGLDGIYAKNQYWWEVDFGEISGWLPESSIIAQP